MKQITPEIIRKRRIRSKITTSSTRPRLTVNISNYRVFAQIIDGTSGKVLCASLSQKRESGKSMMDLAMQTGEDIAKKAIKSKVKKVVLDRGHKKYHGRIKAFAESARQAGLEL